MVNNQFMTTKVFSNIFRLFLIAICIVLYSCSGKSHFAIDTKEIDFVNKTDMYLEGNYTGIEAFGINRMLVKDTFLICITNDPSGMVKVYSTETLKPIISLCMQGRAKNEFSKSVYDVNGQAYYKNNDLILPLHDDMNYQLKEVNISKSIREGSTQVESVSKSNTIIEADFVLLDNDINNRFEHIDALRDEVDDTKLYPAQFRIIDADYNIKDKIIVHPSLMDSEDGKSQESMYWGSLYKHPNKNLVLFSYDYMNYLLFFNMDTHKYYAIHQEGSMTFDDVAPIVPEDGSIYCFSFGAVSKDYIFIRYKAGDYAINSPDKESPLSELLVFDWDGNYLGGAKFKIPLVKIAYNEKDSVLYGSDYNEKILSFDLRNLINACQTETSYLKNNE